MASLFHDSLKIVADALRRPSTNNDMAMLLEDMLTPQEIVEIGERIKLVKMLKAGKTQREIAEELGISVTTVNRGSRVLKYGTGGFRDIL